MQCDLQRLAARRGKHTQYQEIHPVVRRGLGLPDPEHADRRDRLRQAFLSSVLDYEGKRILDIGSNTGYFAISALEAGAAHVECREGYAPHATFLSEVGTRLALGQRLAVRHGYHDFFGPVDRRFDICLCLNVLHHLGDDFGDRDLSLAAAKRQIADAVDALASTADTLVLQLGFNWKGDPDKPLFATGRKPELIEFVGEAAETSWHVEHVAVPGADGAAYTAFGPDNGGRFDELGEFANRPLFVLEARG